MKGIYRYIDVDVILENIMQAINTKPLHDIVDSHIQRIMYGHTYMFVCKFITYSRVWINRVRLPILLVVS